MASHLFKPLFCLFAFWFLVQSASAQTVDALIDKFLAAAGGREALVKLTTRKSTGTVTLSSPTASLSGTFEILLKAPNKARYSMTLDLSAAGGSTLTIDQRFDGVAGVTINSAQGETEITGNQLDNMRNNVFPSPLLTYKEAGIRIELLPVEKLDGKEMLMLLSTPKTGSSALVFMDQETNLVARTVAKITSPPFGEVEQTTDFSDYRSVDGVKVPFRLVITNPVQTVTLVFDRVEHNVPIDDGTFARK